MATRYTVFGHRTVDVEKDVAALRWGVFAQGTETLLVNIHWRLAFDQSEINVSSNYDDLKAALNFCLAAEPLEREDLALLFAAFPMLQQQELWEVDGGPELWDVGVSTDGETWLPMREQRQAPTSTPPTPPQEPPSAPERYTPSLDRKIKI